MWRLIIYSEDHQMADKNRECKTTDSMQEHDPFDLHMYTQAYTYITRALKLMRPIFADSTNFDNWFAL